MNQNFRQKSFLRFLVSRSFSIRRLQLLWGNNWQNINSISPLKVLGASETKKKPPKVCKSLQKSPKIYKSLQKSPKVTKSYQKSPKVSKIFSVTSSPCNESIPAVPSWFGGSSRLLWSPRGIDGAESSMTKHKSDEFVGLKTFAAYAARTLLFAFSSVLNVIQTASRGPLKRLKNRSTNARIVFCLQLKIPKPRQTGNIIWKFACLWIWFCAYFWAGVKILLTTVT